MNDVTVETSPKVSESSRTRSDQDILLAAKGGGIAFSGNLFVYAIRFCFGFVMARFLGADLLGLYSLSNTATEVAGGMALLGLDVGVTRHVPIAIRQKDEASLWGIIQAGIAVPGLLSLALTIGLFLLAEPLSIRVYGRPDLAPVLRLASLLVPLFVMITILTAVTQGFKRMEYAVYAENIAFNVSKLILSVALIGLGLSVMGAMAAYVASAVVTVAMLFYFVHRLFPLNRPLHTAKRDMGKMLRFSIPVYLSQLLRQFGGSIETLVLGFLGVMSGVGIYTTVLRLSSIGTMFHHSLQAIAMPIISDLHSRGKIDQWERVYQTTTKWGMTFNLPIFLIIALFAGPLLSIFGADFVAGAPGLVVLAFSSLFNASTGVCGSVITMTGHSKLTLVNSITQFVVNIILAVLLIPRWGIMGAALCSTLSSVLINILRTIQVYVLFRIWPYNASFVKPVMAAVVAMGVTYFSSQRLAFMHELLQLAIGTLLLLGTYGLMIVLLKFSEEDRLVLHKLVGRLGIKRSH